MQARENPCTSPSIRRLASNITVEEVFMVDGGAIIVAMQLVQRKNFAKKTFRDDSNVAFLAKLY